MYCLVPTIREGEYGQREDSGILRWSVLGPSGFCAEGRYCYCYENDACYKEETGKIEQS
jgi:hypothetical protein